MAKLKGPYRLAQDLPIPDRCRCGGKAERRDYRVVEGGVVFIVPAAHCLGNCGHDYISGEAYGAIEDKKRELGIPPRSTVASRTDV